MRGAYVKWVEQVAIAEFRLALHFLPLLTKGKHPGTEQS